jgi:hypothetical protein
MANLEVTPYDCKIGPLTNSRAKGKQEEKSLNLGKKGASASWQVRCL